MKAAWARLDLRFRFVARTSRDTLTSRPTWLLRLCDADGRAALGECALFHGLSSDDCSDADFGRRLTALCRAIERESCPPEMLPRRLAPMLKGNPALRMGLETACADMARPDGTAMPSAFTEGLEPQEINGLVWMGSREEMTRRVDEKLRDGFRCIKLKIGGIDFEDELEILRDIRRRHSARDLELRLDANGAFAPGEALQCLERLAPLDIHSIEQPIRAGQPDAMAELCRRSPIAIALDEELIGLEGEDAAARLLDAVNPRYIILKPTLCGGLSGAAMLASAARQRGIGSWYTSALESSIGLSAIARAAFAEYGAGAMPQGLGTGELYTNNIPGSVEREGRFLWFRPGKPVAVPVLEWNEA